MEYDDEIYHLAKLSLLGSKDEVISMIKKIHRKAKKNEPELASKIESLLDNKAGTVFRGKEIPQIPVDHDNRMDLLQKYLPHELTITPIWDKRIDEELNQLIAEREKSSKLHRASLPVSKAVMFHGIPGVGKTLAAKWLSWKLNLPLLILDLSAVISSYLGRTGNNIKSVFEYAKSFPCILLLDELDAIAKRRDDLGEIGELKRLVTVLIQEMDNWPEGNLLIAATNHPDLLDPAIWRRFDNSIEFVAPHDESIVQMIIELYFDTDYERIEKYKLLYNSVFLGQSFNEIERIIKRSRRKSLLMDISLEEVLSVEINPIVKDLPKERRNQIIENLLENGFSQRKISELTGLHRATINKGIGG